MKGVLENYGLSLDDIPADMRSNIVVSLEKMSLTPSGESPDSSDQKDKTKNDSNSNSAKVTRAIKGQKELDFTLPQLAGKGYPAPAGIQK